MTLILSIEAGNLGEVEECLAKGADPNVRDRDGTPALHLASLNGHKDIVRHLIERGADIHLKCQKHLCKAIHYASFGDAAEVIELLIKSGLAVEELGEECNTPLHYASGQYGLKAIRVLLECGANVNARNQWGETPLHHACQNGSYEPIQELIDHGAHVNARNNMGATPLVDALNSGHTHIARFLRERGAVE